MDHDARLRQFRNRIKDAEGFLFDLDNTLYPSEKGVFDRVNERIDRYVMRLTGKTHEEVGILRKDYIDSYGTTLQGLMRHHNVEPDLFLGDVHDIHLDGLLEPNPDLLDLLTGIRLPKVVFTNATASHAVRVLNALGVSRCFDNICDLRATGFLGKPHRESYRTAAGMVGSAVEKTVFVDDLEINIRAAIECGMSAIMVGQPQAGSRDPAVNRVQDLEQAFQGMPWFRAG
jgi:putative hydrolase of the HAD superfamily